MIPGSGSRKNSQENLNLNQSGSDSGSGSEKKIEVIQGEKTGFNARPSVATRQPKVGGLTGRTPQGLGIGRLNLGTGSQLNDPHGVQARADITDVTVPASPRPNKPLPPVPGTTITSPRRPDDPPPQSARGGVPPEPPPKSTKPPLIIPSTPRREALHNLPPSKIPEITVVSGGGKPPRSDEELPVSPRGEEKEKKKGGFFSPRGSVVKGFKDAGATLKNAAGAVKDFTVDQAKTLGDKDNWGALGDTAKRKAEKTSEKAGDALKHQAEKTREKVIEDNEAFKRTIQSEKKKVEDLTKQAKEARKDVGRELGNVGIVVGSVVDGRTKVLKQEVAEKTKKVKDLFDDIPGPLSPRSRPKEAQELAPKVLKTLGIDSNEFSKVATELGIPEDLRAELVVVKEFGEVYTNPNAKVPLRDALASAYIKKVFDQLEKNDSTRYKTLLSQRAGFLERALVGKNQEGKIIRTPYVANIVFEKTDESLTPKKLLEAFIDGVKNGPIDDVLALDKIFSAPDIRKAAAKSKALSSAKMEEELERLYQKDIKRVEKESIYTFLRGNQDEIKTATNLIENFASSYRDSVDKRLRTYNKDAQIFIFSPSELEAHLDALAEKRYQERQTGSGSSVTNVQAETVEQLKEKHRKEDTDNLVNSYAIQTREVLEDILGIGLTVEELQEKVIQDPNLQTLAKLIYILGKSVDNNIGGSTDFSEEQKKTLKIIAQMNGSILRLAADRIINNTASGKKAQDSLKHIGKGLQSAMNVLTIGAEGKLSESKIASAYIPFLEDLSKEGGVFLETMNSIGKTLVEAELQAQNQQVVG